MRAPESLETLIEYGILDRVVRPLMSGKEAQVYVVEAGGVECVAKVYKEATQRNFKQRTEYTEGRRTRNTRDQRAMQKRTKHGRKQDETAWRNTEVDMIHRLRDAGVRVPEPINYVDGVLVMELVKDADGHPAPRLGDLEFTPGEAAVIHEKLIREVIRMLCAGVVHGDLSEFNVLAGADGPVVIDFPQSVDPASNQNAGKLLLRDVENLDRFLARFSPGRRLRLLGPEIWALFQANRLKPESVLTGEYKAPEGKADTDEVFALIADARVDEEKRRSRDRGDDEDDAFEAAKDALRPRRIFVDFSKDAKPAAGAAKKRARSRRRGRPAPATAGATHAQRGDGSAGAGGQRGAAAAGPRVQSRDAASDAPGPKRKRRRSKRARSGSDAKAHETSGQTSRQKTNPKAAGSKAGPSKSNDAGGPPRARRRRRRRPAAERPRE